MFTSGFFVGCAVATAWWIYVLSLYDKPKVTPQSGLDTTWSGNTVMSTDGLGNTTEYRPHGRRSGP